MKLDCLFKYSNEYWNENERKLKCKVDVCIYKTKQLIKKYNVDFTEFSIRWYIDNLILEVNFYATNE